MNKQMIFIPTVVYTVDYLCSLSSENRCRLSKHTEELIKMQSILFRNLNQKRYDSFKDYYSKLHRGNYQDELKDININSFLHYKDKEDEYMDTINISPLALSIINENFEHFKELIDKNVSINCVQYNKFLDGNKKDVYDLIFEIKDFETKKMFYEYVKERDNLFFFRKSKIVEFMMRDMHFYKELFEFIDEEKYVRIMSYFLFGNKDKENLKDEIFEFIKEKKLNYKFLQFFRDNDYEDLTSKYLNKLI